jgi:hypothetical protein
MKKYLLIITVFVLTCHSAYADEEVDLDNSYHYEIKKTGTEKYQVILIKKGSDEKSSKTYLSSETFDLKDLETRVDQKVFQLNTALMSNSDSTAIIDEDKKVFNFKGSSWGLDPKRITMGMTPERREAFAAFDRDVELYKEIKKLEKKILELEAEKECPACLNINGVGISPGTCKNK